MRYLTDGTNLYEIAAQRTVTNYGRLRGTISYVIIRDCVSEAIAKIDDLHLAALTEVPRVSRAGQVETAIATAT